MSDTPEPTPLIRSPAAIKADLDAGKPVSVKEAKSLNLEDINCMVEKVTSGELSMCACIGPGYGEPYCPCQMERRGLPMSEARKQANADAERRLRALFGEGSKERKEK